MSPSLPPAHAVLVGALSLRPQAHAAPPPRWSSSALLARPRRQRPASAGVRRTPNPPDPPARHPPLQLVTKLYGAMPDGSLGVATSRAALGSRNAAMLANPARVPLAWEAALRKPAIIHNVFVPRVLAVRPSSAGRVRRSSSSRDLSLPRAREDALPPSGPAAMHGRKISADRPWIAPHPRPPYRAGAGGGQYQVRAHTPEIEGWQQHGGAIPRPLTPSRSIASTTASAADLKPDLFLNRGSDTRSSWGLPTGLPTGLLTGLPTGLLTPGVNPGSNHSAEADLEDLNVGGEPLSIIPKRAKLTAGLILRSAGALDAGRRQAYADFFAPVGASSVGRLEVVASKTAFMEKGDWHVQALAAYRVQTPRSSWGASLRTSIAPAVTRPLHDGVVGHSTPRRARPQSASARTSVTRAVTQTVMQTATPRKSHRALMEWSGVEPTWVEPTGVEPTAGGQVGVEQTGMGQAGTGQAGAVAAPAFAELHRPLQTPLRSASAGGHAGRSNTAPSNSAPETPSSPGDPRAGAAEGVREYSSSEAARVVPPYSLGAAEAFKGADEPESQFPEFFDELFIAYCRLREQARQDELPAAMADAERNPPMSG
ncbi:hypothetical protein T492DRAFT_1010267 [Pavlovales sp. CCMP2436]|nr:hypothetical protein T492DRAFT_1010267 [Pavlovales sp. CCMP2436]